MDWSDWLMLPAERFQERLKRSLDRPILYKDFIGLYNALVAFADSDPARVASISEKVAETVLERSRLREAILFWEMRARILTQVGDLHGLFVTLNRMADEDSSDDTRDIVVELADAASKSSDNFGNSLDQRPRVFSRVMDIYIRFGLKERIAKLHLEAATLYSRHGQSQAAYRSLSDAEEIAIDVESQSLLAEVYSTSVSVACEEGDHDWATRVGEKALSLWRDLAEQPPVSLLSNMGLARMRVDDIEGAQCYYKRALDAEPEDDLAAQIKINLAVCQRVSGQFDEALETILEAEASLATTSNIEARLEVALVAAKISLELDMYSDATSQLKLASVLLDRILRPVLRLHHRRGLRERYIPRIEGMLDQLPSEGKADNVLPMLAAVRTNALADWLSILDWANTTAARGEVDEKESGALLEVMQKLRNFGAPHLFGFREKYDDAWSPMNGGEAWDELASISLHLENRGVSNSPTESASLEVVLDTCHSRLRQGHALMFVTYASDEPTIWCVVGEQYGSARIPLELLVKWKKALLDHASNSINRANFNGKILALLEDFSRYLDPMLDWVSSKGSQSIRYIQDFSDSLPVTSIALRNAGCAARMKHGDFHVRIVSALYPAIEDEDAVSTIVSISSPNDDLMLSPFEGSVFAAEWSSIVHKKFDADDDKALEALASADVVLISSHSAPFQFYTDPYFATMGGAESRHIIGVEALQMHAPDFQARLVMLNACHSGSGLARNYQRRFRSSDLVTYPALFTLDRRAIVSAGAWAMSDTVSFLHTKLASDGLRNGMKPYEALARSIATLPQLTKAEARTILSQVPDENVREEAIKRISSGPSKGMFSQPYVSGGVAIHGLL
ncbi:tetratricopeptide repeat protein [Shimia aestuarii]|uniref:tetratricopeptide repeat protein n=1 Tax=Shimia aestuarii TaxID=254406 RepID=UPI001FB4EC23|nr:tetratricopeptide repeat protein [Shimia aestuarii]